MQMTSENAVQIKPDQRCVVIQTRKELLRLVLAFQNSDRIAAITLRGAP